MRTALVLLAPCVLLAGTSKWSQDAPLAVKTPVLLTEDPQQWRRIDLRVDVAGTWATPFDADEIRVDAKIATPSGRSITVPAFLYQRYERQVWARPNNASQEQMTAAAEPEWRVRFLPTESGRHTLRIAARDKSGAKESASITFDVKPARDHGYIRVSRRDPRYFEFDDGEPYFAIGENMVEGPLSEYYRWIPRLAKNGGNYSRLWIGHPVFALEIGPMGEYRLENAWRLDQVIELSEEYGIRQKLCIDWIRHITPKGEPRKQFDLEDYAYSVSNGGPCRNLRDFFTLPEARRLFRNRLRYSVARWGYSTAVMAWELWNEIDAIDNTVRTDRPLVLDWNAEMCRYLQSVDPARHLTTNSLGSSGFWPEMWKMPENQFAQMHNYYGWHRKEDEELAHDMAGFAIKWMDLVRGFGKPYLFAEFGIIREKPDFRALCDKDSEGVHLHNGLWAPLAHGAAGTGALWWWGQYVDPKNLYFHFLPVARFVKDVRWTTAGFVAANVRASIDSVRVLGLQGKSTTLLWVQNKAHTWWNVAHGTPVPVVEGASVTVEGLRDGRYRLEYWDTWKGVVTKETQARATGGRLIIPLPTLQRDIALKFAAI